LGKNCEFEGKLSFQGEVRIDGRFQGKIDAKGSVVVGETGVLNADIRVSQALVKGTVHGTIAAGERIELKARGQVIGDIEAPTVIMEKGAMLEGNCRMGPPKGGPDFKADSHLPKMKIRS
jgi:cytoskeletal protein CcmA (bactofilin family)